MPEAVRRHINLKIMNKKFNSEKELGFEELEDRLDCCRFLSLLHRLRFFRQAAVAILKQVFEGILYVVPSSILTAYDAYERL